MKTYAGAEIYPLDIGVKWGRGSGMHGIRWDKVDTLSPLGNTSMYDWSDADAIANFYYQNNIHLLWTINPFNRIDQNSTTPTGLLPNDLPAYVTFINALAERYDGDGIDDAPNSPIVNYWQIHNEVDALHFWSDTPENYALLYKTSYDAIINANPNAKVALSGMSAPSGMDYFTSILTELNNSECTFDIFDVHWYGFVGNYKKHHLGDQVELAEFISVDLTNVLSAFSNYEVWMTECGTYSGTDVITQYFTAEPQSEIDQASELVKRYVYALANNVNKIFWLTIEETVSYSLETGENDYFDNIGLIYNGFTVLNGVPIYNPNGVGEDLGEGVKKLSYYTYKKMTEKLEGSDWDDIAIIIDGIDNNYALKFIGESSGKPVYTCWWDYFEEIGDSSLITLAGISANFVVVSSAVPDHTSGLYVADYNTAFSIDTLPVSGGSVSFYLKQRPVFIEEFNSASTSDDIFNSEYINIYPNPTNGFFTIDNVQSFENVVIYNSIGQAIYENKISGNQIAIELPDLLNEIYFVHLRDKNQQNKVLKLVKK